ncbi:class I SAM-dependent methyltransferase [Streptomyces sp. t39]|uniref:class I SAM-dependent methyltransferase n=1 Tax=Streptomyces sp. t39 TaxID=1828156 RepID=UPI0011CE515E|nr:class I SAM-dependent methyltransferase [Streptomyces sp. t39]TXS58114.1 class I SAM-dependent methyltransferase [Streptomyces sp. t39]
MAVETSSADRERPPSDEGRYGERVFRPGDGGEADRIDHGARAYDAFTLDRLRQLGAGPGWRCLDVGAGTGSVARMLLREAGVAEVVAVDRDTRFLAQDRPEGLTPLEADVLADGFAPGRFDLVHARFVLMHLPDPARMTARLAALLAPGGVLVVSDAVDLTTGVAPDGPVTNAVRAMWQGLRDTIGTDVSWVPGCPQLLADAGLESVAAEIHVPPLVAGSPISRFWAQTWERSRDAMVATGLVDDAGVDEAVRGLAAPDFAGLSPGMLTAWGRAPGHRG